MLLAHIGTRDHPEAADEGSGAVANNITIQVGGDNNVKDLGLTEEAIPM